jgi:hypothetical protein
MNAARIGLLAAVTIAALAPVTALADARDYPGRLGDGPRVRGSGRTDFGHRGQHQRSPIIVVPSTVIVAPSDYYAPPPVYSPPPVTYTPAAAYPPPRAYAPPSVSTAPAPPPPPPTAPPEPQVVEFDSGRYELRGDGLREPYVWVWVPKAPSTPPGMAEARRPPATVYRWTDENGVVTLTDDPLKVPPQFRATDITPR